LSSREILVRSRRPYESSIPATFIPSLWLGEGDGVVGGVAGFFLEELFGDDEDHAFADGG
jgi:hypothetical protein